MANILLLGTPTNALSTGATIKGAPLTVLQVDDNFNNINAALSQNITINGSVVQLGGSVTVTANTSNALTAGTGITSGGTFNGSVARTFAIDTAVVATLSGAQALTNKTINGSNNTISNIANASLVNSSVTINGTAVSLGGSATVTANTTNALTAGSGLTSTGTFNGSAARTFAVDSTVVRTTTDQSIGGAKTFTGIVTFSGTAIVKDYMSIAVSDETTAITTGTSKITFRAPYAMDLYAIPRASLSTASSNGNVVVDIKKNGVSIFTTTLSIDQGEKTSFSATTPADMGTNNFFADDDEITIDVVSAGTGAKGLKVTLYVHRTNPAV